MNVSPFNTVTSVKKLLWIIGAAALLASCNKEAGEVHSIPRTDDFTATVAAESRTELHNETQILWEEDDLLSVFSVTSHNRKYCIGSLSEERRSATLTETGEYSGDDWTEPFADVALFPHHIDARLNGTELTTYTAAEQSYTAGKIGLDHSLMVSQAADRGFAFKNAGCLVRFIITKAEGVIEDYTLQSVCLASKSVALAGTVTINLATDNKAVVAEDGSKSVTLTKINTPITNEEQSFYIALPAATLPENDLTITFTFDEAEKVIPLTGSLELLQNNIKTIRYTIAAEDFNGSTPDFSEEEGSESNLTD